MRVNRYHIVETVSEKEMGEITFRQWDGMKPSYGIWFVGKIVQPQPEHAEIDFAYFNGQKSSYTLRDTELGEKESFYEQIEQFGYKYIFFMKNSVDDPWEFRFRQTDVDYLFNWSTSYNHFICDCKIADRKTLI